MRAIIVLEIPDPSMMVRCDPDQVETLSVAFMADWSL